ncbi:MAG: aminodeoxychorismate lyase [Methylovulum sp.]|nr:aminodeoxychorismate lyase [Methylovulum sp.]
MMLINGESKRFIEAIDRGFQYGDGLFETIAVNNGRLAFFDQHLARLQIGCRKLGIPYPDVQILFSEANQLCRGVDRAILKLIVTRGVGGRGYRLPDLIHPSRVLSVHPFPDYPLEYTTEGIRARFCNTRLGLNPALAGIKHLNRLEQVLARAEWEGTAIQEGIMLDVNGSVIEGTMTNLFYVKDNRLYTAILAQSGVAGIIRQLIILMSESFGFPVIMQAFAPEQLLEADEVFVCNSIIGIWPVRQIEGQHFFVGIMTKRIQMWLHQLQHGLISVGQ